MPILITATLNLTTKLICCIAVSCFAATLMAQPGTLDNTFGTSGKVITSIDTFSDQGFALAIQSDQKILLAGRSQSSFISSDFTVSRYLSNGSLDFTFGNNGTAITPIGSASTAYAMAMQSDERIVLAGKSQGGLTVARYQDDGTLDFTFGTAGISDADIPGHYGDQGRTVVIQPNGKIVVGGYAQHSSNDNSYFVLARFNANGILDSTFGSNGMVVGRQGEGHAIVLQSDGKIIMGGASNWAFAMERYHTDGSVDSTFGTNGMVTTAFSTNGKANAMILQSDGKILLTGWANNGVFGSDFATVRYNIDGSLDNTFGTGGIVTTPVGNDGQANAVAIQSDGKILVGGEATNDSTSSHFALVRYTSGGTVDNAFGSGGQATTSFSNGYSKGSSIALDNMGRTVMGGMVYTSARLDFALVRYHSDVSEISDNCCDQLDLKVYPNPFKSSTTLEVKVPLQNAEIILFNTYGQIVKRSENISGRVVQLSRDNLPEGVYFLQILEEGKLKVSDKLVIITP